MVILYGTGGICKLNCFLEIPLTKRNQYCQNILVREWEREWRGFGRDVEAALSSGDLIIILLKV